MKRMRFIGQSILFIFVAILMDVHFIRAQNVSIVRGIVANADLSPLPGATVIDLNRKKGVSTDNLGHFQVSSSNGDFRIEFSYVGFRKDTLQIKLKPGMTLDTVIRLNALPRELGAVVVESVSNRAQTLTRLDLKSIEYIPLPSGNLESMLTTMGASSRNEMSSQYSVRGGNFDENLIYVNDIEINRPLLIKAGQQEGLSFINTSMVSSVQFTAGGFDARYGDKMSSVLDIRYKRPREFGASASVGLLGGSAHLEGSSKHGKFTHITGIRYKTNQYLLNTLETEGDYKPRFFDLQTFLTYNISPKLEVSFLGNIADNYYQVIPSSRETSFGTYQQALNFTVFYEGQEIDRFTTALGALTFDFRPTERLSLKLIGSGYATRESVTYDIWGQYRIDLLDNTAGSETAGDSILNLGVGGSLDHARNFLDAHIYNISHKGSYHWRQQNLGWGIGIQSEQVNNQMKEWEMIDSAGYSIPFSSEELLLSYSATATNLLQSIRTNGYLQYMAGIQANNYKVYLNGGLRFNYWSINHQTVVSPRAGIVFIPLLHENIDFHASIGWYYQPPFYKEIRDPQGNLYRDTRAQKSIHYVVGSSYDFLMWNRPFKFSAEVYYKHLEDLVPYVIDDVDIQYLPQYTANGYAAGIEFKLNGEFVKDAESWATLSFLKTREDRVGDGYGSYPRHTDQLVNFGMFFQDYFPTNPSYKVHINMYFGSRLPYSTPDYDNPAEYYYLKAYKRIDIGVSKSFVMDKEGGRKPRMSGIRDLWISLEVFNLFGFNNQASYQWIRTVSNQEGLPNMYAVPNYLTGRVFNIRLSIKI